MNVLFAASQHNATSSVALGITALVALTVGLTCPGWKSAAICVAVIFILGFVITYSMGLL